MVHTHNGILHSLKKKTNPTICNNMDGARCYYAQWNKPDGERQVCNDFMTLWGTRKKQNMKEQNRSRLTKPKNGLTVTKGKGTGLDIWESRDKGRGKKSSHDD